MQLQQNYIINTYHYTTIHLCIIIYEKMNIQRGRMRILHALQKAALKETMQEYFFSHFQLTNIKRTLSQ